MLAACCVPKDLLSHLKWSEREREKRGKASISSIFYWKYWLLVAMTLGKEISIRTQKHRSPTKYTDSTEIGYFCAGKMYEWVLCHCIELPIVNRNFWMKIEWKNSLKINRFFQLLNTLVYFSDFIWHFLSRINI